MDIENIDHLTELLVRHNVNIDELNKGRKNLNDLYHEVLTKDVRLEVIDVDGRKRICRYALNVRGMIQCGVMATEFAYLFEVARRYGNNGEYVSNWRPYGISETRRRGETVFMAIERGLDEEFDHSINPDRLKISDVDDAFEPPHDSSVYRGVLSSVASRFFFYARRKPIWDHCKFVKDGADELDLKWLRPEQLTERRLIEFNITLSKCFPTDRRLNDARHNLKHFIPRRQSC